jgi:hypothetical protein
VADLNEISQDWKDYQAGIAFKHRIGLYKTVNENEQFYAGNHWEGVDSGPMPQLTFNLVEQIVNFFVSHVMGKNLTLQYSADNAVNYALASGDRSRLEAMKKAAQQLTAYAKTTWNRLKMTSINQQGLLDAALSGDYILYHYWNEKLNTGGGVMGDMVVELIDNVNYFPGNTSEPRTNDEEGPVQPWIIIAFTEDVDTVKQRAKEHGASKETLEAIVPDAEYQYQAGYSARDKEGVSEKKECTVLLRLWPKTRQEPEMDALGRPAFDPETGKPKMREITTIWARQSVRGAEVVPEYDTKLHRYPVAVMNWKPRKNRCHGVPAASALIENNIAINKLMALCYYWCMLLAFPKPIYNSQLIQQWSNDVSEAIAVDGDTTGAARFLQPAGLPPSVLNLYETIVKMTKEIVGANDTALGADSVTKTAAGIYALQKASEAPLAMIDNRFIQFIDDVGLIWADFWMVYYRRPADTPQAAKRLLTLEMDGDNQYVEFDAADYEGMVLNLSIDVGSSTQYSDLQAFAVLNEWLDKKLINFRQYLERIRSFRVVPDVEGLISALDAQDEDKKLLYILMMRFIQTLPPEQQAALEQLRQADEVAFEAQVKQMVLQAFAPREFLDKGGVANGANMP